MLHIDTTDWQKIVFSNVHHTICWENFNSQGLLLPYALSVTESSCHSAVNETQIPQSAIILNLTLYFELVQQKHTHVYQSEKI